MPAEEFEPPNEGSTLLYRRKTFAETLPLVLRLLPRALRRVGARDTGAPADAKTEVRNCDFFRMPPSIDLRLAAMFRARFPAGDDPDQPPLAAARPEPLQYHLLLEAGAAGSQGSRSGGSRRAHPGAGGASVIDGPRAELARSGADAPVGSRPAHGSRSASPRPGAASWRLRSTPSVRPCHEFAQDFDVPGVAQMLRGAVQLYLGVDIAEEGRL